MTNIVDKVQKLLALAAEEGGGTEAERNNAAEKAQSLMLQHRISLDDLEKAKGREALPGIERVRIGEVKQSRFWYGDLLNAIGDEVQVDAIYYAQLGKRRYTLVGRPDMCEYVRTLADWLAPQLEIECEAALIEEKSHSDKWALAWNAGEAAAATMAFKRSFYEGAVAKISHRLSMARREAGQKGLALVRSDRAAIDEFYGDQKPRTVRSSIYEGAGTSAGVDAGRRVDINPNTKVGGADRKEIEK